MTKRWMFRQGMTLDEWAPEYRKHVRFICVVMFALCALALIVVPAAMALRPACQTFGAWLSRMGAVVSVIALGAQFAANNLDKLLTPNSFTSRQAEEIRQDYLKPQKIGNRLAWTLAGMGALIWAFADFLCN